MIPVYNRTQYLERTLTSVLSQDPGAGEMQIEVVDDASLLDDPEPIVRRIAGDRVSFARNPRNLGLMPNFNRCIERSLGHWVHILHTDDFVLPGFYERFQTSLRGLDDVGAAFCRHTIVDEGEHRYGDSELERPTPGVLPGFLETISLSQRIQFAAMVVRRSVYEKLGGFRPELSSAGDWDMWKRIAAQYPVWYEPAILAAFRAHSASCTAAGIRSGKVYGDLRRCIDINRSLLPGDNARTISRKAREWAGLAALQDAHWSLGRAEIAPACKQALEGLKCSCSPRVIGQVALLLKLFVVRGTRKAVRLSRAYLSGAVARK
jgi:glycosyltransferase involved in cell wall biosynthesis